MAKQNTRLDITALSGSGLMEMLEQRMEGYRGVACPGRKLTTRDEQNRALVARGRYFAYQEVLEKLREMGVKGKEKGGVLSPV